MGGLPAAACAGWRAGARAVPDGGAVAPAEPVADAGGDTPRRAASRPLPPGGVLPEFTADTPTSTPPWPLRPPPSPPARGTGRVGGIGMDPALKKAPVRLAHRSL